MPLFGISGSPQAILSTAPDSWVGIQTLRGIGSNRTRLYVDVQGNLWGQFENNPPKLIAGLGSTSTAAVNTVPIGAVFQWASGTAPTGYLLCDGSGFSAGAYPKLAAILGNTFGGASKLPNFAGRVMVGAGNRDYDDPWPGALAVGAKGGNVRFEIKEDMIPTHEHSIGEETGGSHTHTFNIPLHTHTITGTVESHDHSVDVVTSTPWDTGSTPMETDLAHKHKIVGSTIDDDGSAMGGMFSIYTNADDSTTVQAPWDGSHFHDEVVVTDGSSTATTGSAGGHTHTVGVGSAGAHSHTITVASGGDHGHTTTVASAGDHDHTLTVAGEGTHTHDVTVAASGAHTHDDASIDILSDIGGHSHETTVGGAGGHEHTISEDGAHTHTTAVGTAGAHSHNLTQTETGSAGAHLHAAGTLAAELVGNHDHSVADGAYVSTADGAVPAHTHDLDFSLDGDETGADGDIADEETNYISSNGDVTIVGAGGHNHTISSDGAHDHVWSENTSASTLTVGNSVAGLSASATHNLAVANSELSSAVAANTALTTASSATGGKTNSEDPGSDPSLDANHYGHNGAYVRMGNNDWYQDYGGGSTYYAALVADDSEYDLSWDNQNSDDIGLMHGHFTEHEHDSLLSTDHTHTIANHSHTISNTNHGHTISGSVSVTMNEPNNGAGHSHTLTGAVMGTNASAGGHTHTLGAVGAHIHGASWDGDTHIKLTERPTSEVAAIAAHTHSITIEETAAGEHSHTVAGSTADAAAHVHSLLGVDTTSGGGHSHTGVTNEAGAHTHDTSAAPAHVHGVTISAGGVHSHAASIGLGESSPDGGHTHSGTVASSGTHAHTATAAAGGGHEHTATTAAGGGHSHTGSSNETGSHAHSGTTNSNGAHTHTISVGTHDHTVSVDQDVEVVHDVGDETYNVRDDLHHGHYFDVHSLDNYTPSGSDDANDEDLSHTHNIDELTSETAPNFAGSASTEAAQELTTGSSGGNHDHGGKTGSFGSSNPEKIEVIQPWIAINFIIKHD